MATATGKARCAICSKEKSAVRCEGCLQIFCYNHLNDHRQQLSEQMNEIEMSRDLFRQTLNEQMSHPQQHSLIKQIDKWELTSIKRIKQTADECRERIFQDTNEHFQRVEINLMELSDQMREARQENDFNETDLKNLRQNLTQLENKLNQMSNVSIEGESGSFINKISVIVTSDTIKPSKSEKLFNNIQRNNGLTLAVLLDRKQPYTEIDRLDDPEVLLSSDDQDYDLLRRMQGSLVGLAVGDALGASVEFRPNAYLKEHPVKDMQSGGTWGLEIGQWKDDTSMALCLAASLIVCVGSKAFDQFERYRKWYRDGYMSSTGKCFDIENSTRDAITAFENCLEGARSRLHADQRKPEDSDYTFMLEYEASKGAKGLKLGALASAGNGPLVRLAPIPCFYSNSYNEMLKHVAEATQLTHGDPKTTDACQFYAGLIWYALRGTPKAQLLAPNFYQEPLKLKKLNPEVRQIAEGSYKNKRGYKDGIRGKGYIVNALEAALWAFENDNGDFNKGVLLAVNLGDDTNTTAAIYGELAGAVYGINKIRQDWADRLFQAKFIKTVAKGLYAKGDGRKGS